MSFEELQKLGDVRAMVSELFEVKMNLNFELFVET